MRVLVAFDKFKDSLTAAEACDVAAHVISGRDPGWQVDRCPLSDGGEGFSPILTRQAGGECRQVPVCGPLGGPVQAPLGLVPLRQVPEAARQRMGLSADSGSVAVIDMASASGLALVPPDRRDLLSTSTRGTGELIAAAHRAGARAIVLGVGGSATHDLGLGALEALGVRFLGDTGARIMALTPSKWHSLAAIEGGTDPGLPEICIACDVDNPVLGPRGALSVYGPQKGLRPQDAAALERQTARVAALVCRHFGKPETLRDQPGAGAAGGIAFGLLAAAPARIVSGFDLVSAWLDLDARIAAADLVITGEGRFDDSSLSGKGPGSVTARALKLGKPVQVFAGALALTRPVAGLRAHAISPEGLELAQALAQAGERLAASLRQFIAFP